MYKQHACIDPLSSGIDPDRVKDRSYRSYVEECADALITHATDRYGTRHSPLLVTILDVRTKECPERPPRTTCGPAARPAYFPSPYRNWQYGGADLSWGGYHAYRWKAAADSRSTAGIGSQPCRAVSLSLQDVRALCVRVKLQEGCGAGLSEWRVNAGEVRPSRKAGSYFVEGAGSANSTYADQEFINTRECLQQHFVHNLEALDDEVSSDAPVFVWQERGIGYSSDSEAWRPRRGTNEWVMYEFDDPVGISSIELWWHDDGGAIRLPESWELFAAHERDDTAVTYPPVGTVPWRGENRDSFWRPRASDFFEDQPTFRAFYELAQHPDCRRFAEFSDASLSCAMELRGAKGMFWWGSHRYYDVFTEALMTPNGDHHEILTKRPAWEHLWRLDPQATREELEGIWAWHVVDKETGEHNRHNNGKRDHSFAASGGQFIYALAFLYSRTGDETYLNGAKRIADFHWKNRNPSTGLTPSDPDEKERWDGFHCGHQVIGYHCYYLLKAYELTGEETFLRNAHAYLKAFAVYGYDEDAGRYYGTVNVETGAPVGGSRVYPDYRAQMPAGHADLWQPYQYGYEHALQVAQCYAYAYTVSQDSDMLKAAERWAEHIRAVPPRSGCRTDTWYELYARLFGRYGAFAEHYGRVISFFVNMHAGTGVRTYLGDACRFADEAVSSLYYQGLFRGHPARPYYSSVDGVGYLLVALLQLDGALRSAGTHWGGADTQTRGVAADGCRTIGLDNW